MIAMLGVRRGGRQVIPVGWDTGGFGSSGDMAVRCNKMAIRAYRIGTDGMLATPLVTAPPTTIPAAQSDSHLAAKESSPSNYHSEVKAGCDDGDRGPGWCCSLAYLVGVNWVISKRVSKNSRCAGHRAVPLLLQVPYTDLNNQQRLIQRSRSKVGNFRLGNAWHIPGNPEPRWLPRGIEGMRTPVFPTLPVTAVTVFSGNQFAGGGNPGNQLQQGSSVSFKRSANAGWTSVPMTFRAVDRNNKYYSADIPVDTLEAGDVVQYYVTIAYDDHDRTFLKARDHGMTSVPTGDEAEAKDAPFTFSIDTRDKRGHWEDVFDLPNAAIHTHVLPNGLVLMWGRRDDPNQSLDVDPPNALGPGQPPAKAATCTPFLWNPSTNTTTKTSPPIQQDGQPINLFCSGHTFLPDGRLLVVGGHLTDGVGLNQAAIYDPASNTWTPQKVMKNGRWYPTASGLPDGSVLVVSGSYLVDPQKGMTTTNIIPEVWKTDSTWMELSQSKDPGLTGDPNVDLYPRQHLASDGKIYLTGAQPETWALEVSKERPWSPVAKREMQSRDYAPSVMYEVDENSSKVIYIGGGNPPAQAVEHIDLLQEPAPQWKRTPDGDMTYPRRQHNATILPDGTVLVTGGTRGLGFDDVDAGQPVHIVELWHPPTRDDPATGTWTQLAAEHIDRCYHSTAVLLADATVLSAGGGEYYLDEKTPQQRQNDPQDTHRDAQIFRPPYLSKGVAQPEITSAPESVNYGETFEVRTGQPNEIERVTWIRLSSVTHSFNTNQRFIELKHELVDGKLRVSAPTSANVCPPGHYMLFILNRQGVPSVAKIMQMKVPTGARGEQARRLSQPPASAKSVDAVQLRHKVRNAARGTEVVVGITSTCPYGIGACWGSAHGALRRLEGVQYVDPIPDANNSTATVFLHDEGLPALDRWDEQFRSIVNMSYVLRGVEITLTGVLEAGDGELLLTGDGSRPPIHLEPLASGDKIQWDFSAGGPEPPKPGEADAYDRLTAQSENLAYGQRVTITGPLQQTDDGYELKVRMFNNVS